jgi:hypothetical protein
LATTHAVPQAERVRGRRLRAVAPIGAELMRGASMHSGETGLAQARREFLVFEVEEPSTDEMPYAPVFPSWFAQDGLPEPADTRIAPAAHLRPGAEFVERDARMRRPA